ncbi:MAG: hypothetical protein ACD_75C02519G0002, partial [uncultured bacterium]
MPPMVLECILILKTKSPGQRAC